MNKKTFRYEGKKGHFLSKIKDGDTTIIIYKTWSKTRRKWSYRVEEEWLMEYSFKLSAKMS